MLLAIQRLRREAPSSDWLPSIAFAGISATGMPDGAYRLGEIEVEVHAGRCTANSVLSGSVLTLDRGVRNLMAFTGTSPQTAVVAASHNPAQLIGQDTAWGALAAGRKANITVLSPSAEVIQTFLVGRPAVPPA